MNELALFAGIGGGILGGKLLGWRTVCAVEREPYCIQRLMQRQDEGHLDPFPIWDDVRTFDGNPWRGLVDVVSGGFPCQDISCAGTTGKHLGLDWVGENGSADTTSVPAGRRLKGAPPGSLDAMVRQLVGALAPPSDAYPLPHFRRRK